MAYRTITVGNGDTIRVSESVLRGAGPEGPLGPVGPPGTATTIRGHFPTYNDLVTSVPIGSQGDGYITDDDGTLWTWDVEEDDPQWIDCGRIVGPAAVLSVGATRSRTDNYVVISRITWVAEYQTTTNDADSLGGFVLDPELTTATKTVVGPVDTMYYIVTTDFRVESSVFNQMMEFSFLNLRDGSVTAVANIEINGDLDFNAQYQAILVTNNSDEWLLQVKSTDDAVLSKFITRWNRIAGGPGPTGPTGPHPTLEAGTVTVVPNEGTPSWVFVETPPGSGHYVVNMDVVEGPDGNANSGFNTFDNMITGGDSEASTGETPDTWTDQGIPVPDHLAKPSVPWYFRVFADGILRRLVSRLSATEIPARGVPEPGEMIFDTTENRLILGQVTPAGNQHFIVPTIEYGQDASIIHNAVTSRPDGSLYFKYDS